MDNEMIIKYIDYCLKDSINDIGLNFQYYYKKIKYYTNLIKLTEQNKPFFFQKKKLKEYYEEIAEYNNIIKEASIKLDEEAKLIKEIMESVS